MPLDHLPSPVNALPPVVWGLFFAIVGIEGLFALGEAGLIGGPSAVGWRLEAVNRFGFSGQAFDYMVSNGRIVWEYVPRFVTYLFIHGGFTSALFAGVILLAMGKLAAESIGQVAVLGLFFTCGIVGSVLFGLLSDQAWLIGAFPGVYGLIGSFTFLFWQRLAASGQRQLRAFQLIGILMALQLIFGIFVQVGYTWVAELAGFCCGFFLTGVLIPGGWARMVAAIRRRR